MCNFSEEEALVLYERIDLDLMKISQIVAGARLFADISSYVMYVQRRTFEWEIFWKKEKKVTA